VIGFIEHLEIVTTSTLSLMHTLYSSLQYTKFSQSAVSSPVVVW
jgi:hypothetical protein